MACSNVHPMHVVATCILSRVCHVHSQPGMVKSSSEALPSVTLLRNYETIRSHLSAARSLANF